jgi:hypothetical protein
MTHTQMNDKLDSVRLLEKFNSLTNDSKTSLLKEVYTLAYDNRNSNIAYTDNVLDMIKTILLNKEMTFSQWKSLSMYRKMNITDKEIREKLDSVSIN